MKKSVSVLALALLSASLSLHAQPAPEKEADGYLAGEVVLADNSIITGSIKESIRKKGEITILRDGKKTKLKADDITSVRIGSNTYVTNGYTFYELVWQGANISLLRKANEPSGVRYNGAEPIVISNSEGDVGDYFVKTGTSFSLVTKKNAAEVLKKICSSCNSSIDEAKFDASIRKAVEDCDKCK